MESKTKYRVVFVRHGQSTWNQQNIFTGWTDVPLTELGDKEAKQAGKILKEANFEFDIAFTSVLKRSIITFNNICDELDCYNIDVQKHWRLNERHYGGLQGLNKAETAKKHGDEQVKIWRRSYDIPPPLLDITDQRHPKFEKKYAKIPIGALPCAESLKDCVARVLPFWNDTICKNILENKNVLVVAHGNSIRAIVKHLDSMNEADIMELNIPTAVPLVYEFDENMKAIKHYYLGNQEELSQKMQDVANQGKSK